MENTQNEIESENGIESQCEEQIPLTQFGQKEEEVEKQNEIIQYK